MNRHAVSLASYAAGSLLVCVVLMWCQGCAEPEPARPSPPPGMECGESTYVPKATADQWHANLPRDFNGPEDGVMVRYARRTVLGDWPNEFRDLRHGESERTRHRRIRYRLACS